MLEGAQGDVVEREQRYHVTAEIGIRAPPGVEFQLEDIELVKHGSFHDAEGEMDIELGSTLGELRKLALVSDQLHEMVARVTAPDEQPAILHLRATPPLLRKMAIACAAIPGEPTPDQLVENQAWLRAALSFDEYEPRSLDVLERPPLWRQA